MHFHHHFLLALLLAASPLAHAQQQATAKNRAVSSSKQFIVFALDSTTRSRTLVKAEDYKGFFLDLLKIPDNWKHPIILNLGAPPPDIRRPPKYNIGIYEADGGTLKIQLDVFDLAFLEDPGFEQALLQSILLEFAYRDTPIRSGRAYQNPPDWAVTGILEKYRSSRSQPKAAVFSSLLASGQPPEIDDFFRTRLDKLDTVSRALYGAQALTFIETLLSLPKGHQSLVNYLYAPRRSPTDLKEFLAFFPTLENKRENLSRPWLLAIAKASSANRIDLLTLPATGRELARILDVKALPDPKNPEVASMSGPYALETIARSESGGFILSQMSADLMRLALRAHPLYKPLVDDYLRIVNELIAKPKRRVDKRIAAAEAMRASLDREKSEVEGYLDWVEGTKLTTDSEQFTEVLEDIQQIEEPPPRRDVISQYLDSVAERGW